MDKSFLYVEYDGKSIALSLSEIRGRFCVTNGDLMEILNDDIFQWIMLNQNNVPIVRFNGEYSCSVYYDDHLLYWVVNPSN